jgi:hypothetical protein
VTLEPVHPWTALLYGVQMNARLLMRISVIAIGVAAAMSGVYFLLRPHGGSPYPAGATFPADKGVDLSEEAQQRWC